MSLDYLSQRNAHLFLDSHGIVYVARDAKEFRSMVVLSTHGGEPGGSSSDDGRNDRDSFDVGHCGRTSVESDVGREGRFEPWLTRLAFETLNQSGLFSADVSPGSGLDIDVEVVT